MKLVTQKEFDTAFEVIERAHKNGQLDFDADVYSICGFKGPEKMAAIIREELTRQSARLSKIAATVQTLESQLKDATESTPPVTSLEDLFKRNTT